MKLVGTYKATVKSVDVGRNEKGNDILKLGLDVTDEYQNGQWFPLAPTKAATKHFSLRREVTTGFTKSQAQITVESLKETFGFTGGFAKLHDLMFAQCEIVCEDHERGNFTSIKYMNNINGKKKAAELVEFAPEVISELEKIFSSIA